MAQSTKNGKVSYSKGQTDAAKAAATDPHKASSITIPIASGADRPVDPAVEPTIRKSGTNGMSETNTDQSTQQTATKSTSSQKPAEEKEATSSAETIYIKPTQPPKPSNKWFVWFVDVFFYKQTRDECAKNDAGSPSFDPETDLHCEHLQIEADSPLLKAIPTPTFEQKNREALKGLRTTTNQKKTERATWK